MLYSCAMFATPETSLEEAQLAKLDAICRKLELRPDDHLLEIGTGWGGLAIHAAARYGCRVTTTTISREQHALATERVRAAGLEDRVTVLLRGLPRPRRAPTTSSSSIEMIEAVGWRNFDRFFARVRASCSQPDGLALLQAITIDDRAYEVEKAARSFITTFIFPGGCLPSMEVMARCVRRRTDLQWSACEDITARLRAHAAPLARELPGGGAGARAPLATTSASGGSGGSTCATARAGFVERRITRRAGAAGAKPGYRPRRAQPRGSRREHAPADRVEQERRAARGQLGERTAARAEDVSPRCIAADDLRRPTPRR